MTNGFEYASVNTILAGCLVFLGAICFFSEVYHQKRKLLKQTESLRSKIAAFDILFTFLMLLIPLKMLLSFDFSILICAFIIIFSLLDIILYRHLKSFRPWWQYCGRLKKYALALLALVLLFGAYLIKEHNSFIIATWLILFCTFNLFLMCLKAQIKNSDKTGTTNQSLRFLISLQIFYSRLSYFAYQFFAIIIIFTALNTIYSDLTDPAGNRSDTCLDTGLCREGYIFDNCDGKGNPCTVNRDFCLKSNSVWYEEIRICDTRKRPVTK